MASALLEIEQIATEESDVAPRKTKANGKNVKASSTRNKHNDPRESFHLPAKLHAALLEFVKSHETPPGKSAVMRVALEKYLESKGFWTPERGK